MKLGEPALGGPLDHIARNAPSPDGQLLCDASEIQVRRAFLNLQADDHHNLDILRGLIAEEVDGIIAEFYAHLAEFAELRRFVADPMLHEHLKQTQRQYLLSLGQGADKPAYFEDRLRIGRTHERVGLPPKWYLGAYATLFDAIARRLANRFAGQAQELASLLTTLQKIFTLDSSLAIEMYHQASLQRLDAMVRQLTEAQKQLQKLSRIDGLTQVYNRAYLMEVLEREFQRSQRFRRAFSLLFIDLDHFKRINDRHGHACGDAVLQQSVHMIQGMLRAADVLGRYGGEEFLVGLVEMAESTAEHVAQRIRVQVGRRPIEAEGNSVALTLSVGVASLSPETERLEELLRRADRALYRAKGMGRNQVCVGRE